LRELYPDFVARLTDLLQRIQQADAEVSRVRYAKPIDASDDGRHLRSVELEAREIEGFVLHHLSILRDLKLPSWEQGSALAWPPGEAAQRARAAARGAKSASVATAD
jgi:hypothetical protein